MSAPRVAVLAVQGAFAEHEAVLRGLGCETLQLRQRADVLRSFDALVLPGGESTVQAKLLRELGMLEALACAITEGMPVLGTCAGLILLARDVREGGRSSAVHGFGTLPVTVERNAYGRQLGSFHAVGQTCAELTNASVPMPLRFIRAPRIVSADAGVETIVSMEGDPVCVRFGNQIGCAFHPELTADDRIHRALMHAYQMNARSADGSPS